MHERTDVAGGGAMMQRETLSVPHPGQSVVACSSKREQDGKGVGGFGAL